LALEEARFEVVFCGCGDVEYFFTDLPFEDCDALGA